MRPAIITTILAAVAATAADLPTGIQGFNSGATFADSSAKKQKDWKKEFETASKLNGSPGVFNSVRLYTMIQAKTDTDIIQAIPAAIETKTTMLLGIWCSGPDGIDQELKALKGAIDKHGKDLEQLVVAISVGSEDLYRTSESGIENKSDRGRTPKEMVEYIQNVRDAIKGTVLETKPVGHVDAWSAWSNTSNSEVLDAVDFIGADLYPYYEKDKGNSFDNVTNVFDYIFGEVEAVAGNKPIWIAETGHPTSGPTFGEAQTGVDKAAEYWQQIGCAKIFGKMNVWWYNLRDSNPANKEKFAITDDLSVKPKFNLSCRAEYVEKGAPAATNLNSAADVVSRPTVFAVAVACCIALIL
jgi:glucan endo-1,3-beta-D-glucosidase